MVQRVRQHDHSRLDLAKAQINTDMNSSFLCVFHRIANTHLRRGSEGEPSHTASTVPACNAFWDVRVCVCVFLYNLII